MNILEIIEKRICNKTLTDNEIQYVINNYVNKVIPNYQMSAFLMTLIYQNFTKRELYVWTKVMMESGGVVNLKKHPNCHLIDKHSTGGIGDKVSIIIAPLLVSLGINLVKLSGRALGKTGGTIDKLLSIPDINLNLTAKMMQDVYDKSGMVIAEQTKDLVPADKYIYNLRNVTSTVKNVSLIASSILSKKFIINTDLVVIDLKCGKGALCETIEESLSLVKHMLDLSNQFHKKIYIHVTNMNSPLGNYVGNALEIYESLLFLNDLVSEKSNLSQLIYQITTDIIKTFNHKVTEQECYDIIKQKIVDKSAFYCFKHWVISQGGQFDFVTNLENNISKIKNQQVIYSKKTGYFKYSDCGLIGLVVNALGGNIKSLEEKIDIWAGVKNHCYHNQLVKIDQPLFTLYSDSRPITKDIIDLVNCSFEINDQLNNHQPIILKILKNY